MTNQTIINNLLDFQKIREITPIISYKTRNTCLFAHTIDSCTILITGCQWFFHIHRFTGSHSHNCKCSVTRWRRCDINGIDLCIINQFLRIGIPFPNVVSLSIRSCLVFIPTHYSHHFRSFHFIKSRSRLLFRDFSTTDKSPIDHFHNSSDFAHKVTI